MLILAVPMIAIPIASAHSPPWTSTTYCYIAPCPPTVGTGQQVLLVVWINPFPPTAIGAMGDRWTFYVDITKPDGTTQTLGPLKSDPTGSTFTSYTPTLVGTYTLIARFPGQTLTGVPGETNSVYVNDTFSASTSKPVTITVQQQPIPSYQETPIPTGYWTRPVYDTNRGWGANLMGEWLGGAYYESLRTWGIPNTEGPTSSHVLWSRSYWSGGIIGGQSGDSAFYNGIAYEGFSSPLVVLEGKAYYADMNPPYFGWYCIDLYTGQTIYYENNTYGNAAMPTMGQILDYNSPNQDGGFAYLWRTSGVTLAAGNTTAPGLSTWEMLDAFSGNSICKIANVSTAGTQFRDSIGSICYLSLVNLGNLTNPNYYMQIWNTTQAIWWRPSYGISPPATLINGTSNVPNTAADNSYWMWRPGQTTVSMSSTQTGATYNGYNGYSMNVSIASLAGPWNNIIISSMFGTANATASVQQIVPDQYLIVGVGGQNDARAQIGGFLRGISLKAPTWGQTLWTTTFMPPASTDLYPNNTYSGGVSFGGLSAADNIFWFTERVTGKIWVYNLQTGQQIWTYTMDSGWSYYGTSLTAHDGKAYTIGTAGILNCFDAATGKMIWNWTAPFVGYLETQGLQYTPLSLAFFVDDPVTGEHLMYLIGTTGWAGETSPIRRDAAIWCIDADTGRLIWDLTAYPNTANNALSKVVISDDRIMYLDNHDNQIYCLGKGPSATTVTASPSVSAKGSQVLFQGTVTDQSPGGRLNINGDLDFTLKGTPAISDSSMDAWMEYMFHQRPMPTNATGVTVHLTAIDPNGNFQDIGNATNDIAGNYGLSWTPPVPGTYKVTATFAGSNSYGSSFSTTYITVSAALLASPAANTNTPAPSAPPQTSLLAPTATPAVTTAATPSPVVIPPASATPTATYIAIGAAVVIIVAAAAVLAIRRRK